MLSRLSFIVLVLRVSCRQIKIHHRLRKVIAEGRLQDGSGTFAALLFLYLGGVYLIVLVWLHSLSESPDVRSLGEEWVWHSACPRQITRKLAVPTHFLLSSFHWFGGEYSDFTLSLTVFTTVCVFGSENILYDENSTGWGLRNGFKVQVKLGFWLSGGWGLGMGMLGA